MSRIYSSSNRIKFTDIPEKYAVPRAFRGKQSEVHSAVVTYVFEHYHNTKKYRQRVVDALNRLTYCILQSSPPPFKWVSTDPLNTMPDDIEIEYVEQALGDYCLSVDAIEWDVPTSYSEEDTAVAEPELGEHKLDENVSETSGTHTDVSAIQKAAVPGAATESRVDRKVSATTADAAKLEKIVNRPLQSARPAFSTSAKELLPTPKEDLYIQPPRCPRFDVNKIWMSASAGGDNLVIYTTLPEVPTCQNEISVTTDPTIMTDSEFMKLYPNHVIHTRSPRLYEFYEGCDYDEDLGCILPISGFTREQVIDNIIKYPHLYRLRKIGPDGSISKFFSTLEIDGELVPVDEIWDTLPEAKNMPRDAEFVKEYVIRRYLLEEEAGIHHNYHILGSLDPFLTLFMPCTKYIERGYTNTLEIVKKCVMSRINYKRSRSPILRRIEKANSSV